jgi:subtilisin family serine protease
MNNEKLENLLNLALDATPMEREKSLELNVGYDPADSAWQVIVKSSGGLTRLQEKYPDMTVESLLNGYAILTLPASLLETVAAEPEIEYVEKPKRLFFAVAQGRSVSCITPLQMVQNAGTSYARDDLYGAGVLVAVIDSGIDYAHPDFCNEDGTTRIVELWDQTLNQFFDSEQINEALAKPDQAQRFRIVPSRDSSGHGTHVAGICAGNGRASGGQYKGVASKSQLLIVKLGVSDPNGFPRTTELMRAVDYVLRKAFLLKMPVAVNLSFGNNYGSHDSTSLLETYLDGVSSYWKSVIVTGTGNEGSSRIHSSGMFVMSQTGSYPSQTVQFSVGAYESGLNLQIWKSYTDEVRFQIRHPNGTVIGPFAETIGTQRFTLGDTELLIYYGTPTPYSTSQEIYLDFIPRGQYVDEGIWELILTPVSVVTGTYDLWLPGQSVIGSGTGFLYPIEHTTLTIPSTASKVISVGAYNASFDSYASFSGRGFTRQTNQVKPDLVAPGVDIVSAAPGGGYTAKSGTSMAAPFVTGSAALMMQWGILRGNDPFLYGEKAKAYLQRGARKLPGFAGYPNEEVGYGEDVIIRSHSRKPVKSSVSTRFPRTEKEHFDRYFEENLPGLDSKYWCGCDL